MLKNIFALLLILLYNINSKNAKLKTLGLLGCWDY